MFQITKNDNEVRFIDCEPGIKIKNKMYVKDDQNGRTINYKIKGRINAINVRINNNNDTLNIIKLDILKDVEISDDMITRI